MTGQEPIRVALVGYGLAGRVFHAPLIRFQARLQLSAIVVRDAGRRAQAGQENPGVLLCDDLASALQGRPGLVVIASPNETHVRLAESALRAGCAVVVDKPLAATAAEGRALVQLAGELGLMLTVFQNRRWDADLLTVQRLLQEGVLGRVNRFENSWERFRPVPSGNWREGGDPAAAGGLLADLGSHLVDQAMLLFGPVASVYAELDRRREGSQVDDDSFVALTHRSGVRSHIAVSALSAAPAPRMRVIGSAGAFVKHGLDVQEAMLRSGLGPQSPGWGLEPEEARGEYVSGDRRRGVPGEPGRYEAFYAGVAAALRDGAPAPVDPRGVVDVLEVLDAARVSHREQRVVDLAS